MIECRWSRACRALIVTFAVLLGLEANVTAGDPKTPPRRVLLMEVDVVVRLPRSLLPDASHLAPLRRESYQRMTATAEKTGRKIRDKILSLPHCSDARVHRDSVEIFGGLPRSVSTIVVIRYDGISLSRLGDNQLVYTRGRKREYPVFAALNTAVELYRIGPGRTPYLKPSSNVRKKKGTWIAVYSVHDRKNRNKTYRIEERHTVRVRMVDVVIPPRWGCE